MGACVDCGASGLFLLTSKEGLCRDCRQAVRSRFEAERKRLKDALVVAEVSREPGDQALHLRRAMKCLRVLAACEDRGCGPLKPELRAVARSVSARLQELAVVRGDDAGRPSFREVPPAEPAAPAEPEFPREERRRARRRSEALPVRLGKGRIRALTMDASAGGLGVHSPVPQRPGVRIPLVLHRPEGPVPLEGLVRWVRPAGRSNGLAGAVVMGLEFSNPESSDERRPAGISSGTPGRPGRPAGTQGPSARRSQGD